MRTMRASTSLALVALAAGGLSGDRDFSAVPVERRARTFPSRRPRFVSRNGTPTNANHPAGYRKVSKQARRCMPFAFSVAEKRAT